MGKKLNRKLNVMDYIFRYKGEDLTNCQAEYCFDTMTITEINKDSYDIPVLHISINADDKLNFNYVFEYSIKIDLDELNKLPDKPTNINDYICQGQTYFENPYVDGVEKINSYLSLHLNESMYHEKSNFLVAKLQQNKFIFKVSIPEHFIFIWFIIDFD